jgi:hypothetical protein
MNSTTFPYSYMIHDRCLSLIQNNLPCVGIQTIHKNCIPEENGWEQNVGFSETWSIGSSNNWNSKVLNLPQGLYRQMNQNNYILTLKGPIHDQSCCATLRVVQHDWPCMVLIDLIVNGQTCIVQNNFAQHDWSCMGRIRIPSSGMWHLVVWSMFTNVLEESTAAIFKFNCITFEKIVFFIFTTVRTSNLTNLNILTLGKFHSYLSAPGTLQCIFFNITSNLQGKFHSNV